MVSGAGGRGGFLCSLDDHNWAIIHMMTGDTNRNIMGILKWW